ncbi:zinc finger protein [Stylonychia lemnae]|uniref:Zinc finger protein n=1 Tax=Stylonychia lemnae TaxID=5949 RepID=A0A078A2C3_STYLE|nr:zinc finger protein [Stylonychia lemnae]|eukprot:CDW75663.1 zinc finger protein [Stylonychia lemnae]
MYQRNENQYESQHLNQFDGNQQNNQIELMESIDNHQQNAPLNNNQDPHYDPNADLPPPMENLQESLRRISTRQQSFRELRQNLDNSAQTAREYNEIELRKVKKQSIQYFITTAVTCGVWVGYGVGKRDTTKIRTPDYNCDTPISTWLIVMGATYGLQCIYYLYQMILVFTKKEKAKPAIQLLSLANFCLIINFQVAWLIYGNTFHYTRDSMRCKDNNDDFKSMWVLMMISIAFGYILFLVYGLLTCCCLCASCILCCGGGARNGQQPQFVGRIPYMNAVKTLNKKNFKNIDETNKNMTECLICLAQFQDDEEITELNCDKRHYFHTECIQSWMKKKLECPLCKKQVGAVEKA